MEEMNYAIGMDMGGSHIRIGLVCNGKVVDTIEFKVKANLGLELYLEEMEDSIDLLLKNNGIERIVGVGVSFPGLVDVERKMVTATFGKYDDIMDMNFGGWIEKRWRCKYFIDLDARMSAVGEWRYGAGRGYDSLVMVTIGTGIGTAVINEGKVLRGKHFQAGSFGGHFIVDLEGPACSCGGRGCIEAHTGTWSASLQAKNNPRFGASQLARHQSVGYREIFGDAAKGDELAQRLRDKSLKVWAAGIVSYIHAYDPEVVVLGGSVMNNAEYMLPFIQDFVDRNAVTPWGKVKVISGELLDDSAILGAVYCMEKGV